MSLSFILLAMFTVDLKEAAVKYAVCHFADDVLLSTRYQQQRRQQWKSFSFLRGLLVFSLP